MIRYGKFKHTFTVYRCFRSLSSSKVPEKPTWEPIDDSKLPQNFKVGKEEIDLLERLSLVEFNNQAGIDRLNSAIKCANRLQLVNTDGVEPMDSVLEDRDLYLAEDSIVMENSRDDILQNASKTVEEYYVAPPGNIPLQQRDRDYGNDT